MFSSVFPHQIESRRKGAEAAVLYHSVQRQLLESCLPWQNVTQHSELSGFHT